VVYLPVLGDTRVALPHGDLNLDGKGGRGIACVSGLMLSETAARKRPLSIVAQLDVR